MWQGTSAATSTNMDKLGNDRRKCSSLTICIVAQKSGCKIEDTWD